MNKPTASQLGINSKAGSPFVSTERAARETASLNALVAGLNKEAGVEAPKQEPVAQSIPHRRSPFNPRLIFYTGRLKSGKDFVAAATGATIFGFADPLYAMRKYFFGEVDKDKFGARETLQLFGQWGRGTVNAQYPLNASRASFIALARELGDRGDFGDWAIDWKSFGRTENIWLDGMLRRVEAYRSSRGNEETRIASVNVRFANEHKALTEAGWCHFHVLCSTQTWEERIRAAGLDPKAPAVTDLSEQMAIGLDRQAIQVSHRSPNSMVRCIWNDEKQPSPAPKAFHTLKSFKEDLDIFS
jgi:hypothetical protein